MSGSKRTASSEWGKPLRARWVVSVVLLAAEAVTQVLASCTKFLFCVVVLANFMLFIGKTWKWPGYMHCPCHNANHSNRRNNYNAISVLHFKIECNENRNRNVNWNLKYNWRNIWHTFAYIITKFNFHVTIQIRLYNEPILSKPTKSDLNFNRNELYFFTFTLPYLIRSSYVLRCRGCGYIWTNKNNFI